jgi:decaprenyl-phosphate phosphoribosyltransferase
MLKVKPYLELARPHQYVKNGFVWLPILFGHRLQDWHALGQTFWAFVAFCLVASSVYILNDLKDIKEDRQHPVKRLRPLARGAISQFEAICFFFLLLALSTLVVFIFIGNKEFFFIIEAYLLLNIFYSFVLKHIAIIDIVCIATGFVLRVFAGGIAGDVPISHWIIIMSFLLAVFLALAKRRDDIILASQGHNVRKSVDGYNLDFISSSMAIMASVVIVAYLLYTVSPETVARHGTNKLYLTSFWVIVGLLRYLQLTVVEERTGSPTKLLLKDHLLQLTIFLWILSNFIIIYVSQR